MLNVPELASRNDATLRGIPVIDAMSWRLGPLRLAGLVLLCLLALDVWWLAPAGGGGLVIYASVGDADLVAQEFTRRTGIPAQIIDSSTGSLLARVAAEGHTPHWDLVWFEGDTAAAALDMAGLLRRQPVPDLPWTEAARQLLPPDGAYVPTGITLSTVLVLRGPPPATDPVGATTLAALPALAGRQGICTNNPARSGGGYPLLAGLLQQAGGWPAARATLTRLAAQGLRVCEPSTPEALLSGSVDAGLMQSSAALYFVGLHPGYALRVIEPAAFLPSVIAAAAGRTPQRTAWARAFVEFAAGPGSQGLRRRAGHSDALFWPAVEGAPDRLPILGSLTQWHVTTLDPYGWGGRQATILQWFAQRFAGQER